MPLSHINPANYEQQLTEKAQRITSQFTRFSPPELEVFPSPPLHYRMRAEFRVWHEGDDLFYIMFDQETRERFRVDQFPVANQLINRMMARLVEEIKDIELLRRKLFQVDFLSTQSGQILVSMLYHKQLDEQWRVAIKALQAKLSDEFDVHFVGRAKKQKFIVDRDYVIETLHVKGKPFTYKQVENSFTQPNAAVNELMLTWAIDKTAACTGDLLELYCGNGNFSIPMAQHFDKVLATEIAKSSVDSAQFNIRENGVDNLVIARLSSEEFTQALEGKRQFNRLKDINLNDYNCQTILVDPPRAGMDPGTCSLVSRYQTIVYISCNPDTLERDVAFLSDTHNVTSLAIFDQFPYTHHVECGVILTRK